jgi:hypothetical protein
LFIKLKLKLFFDYARRPAERDIWPTQELAPGQARTGARSVVALTPSAALFLFSEMTTSLPKAWTSSTISKWNLRLRAGK